VYLVDTNVISEARKGARANAGVRAFFRDADAADLYISVQTVGEIRRGLESIRRRGDAEQAGRLETWLEGLIRDFSSRILAFDQDCAQVWGCLMSPHPQHPIDKQIAAIALIHDLTVVTRNVDDFRATAVTVKNPFD
jgi:predicted nucleic acid-binding protein